MNTDTYCQWAIETLGLHICQVQCQGCAAAQVAPTPAAQLAETPSHSIEPDAFLEWLDKEISWNENMEKSVPVGISPNIFEARKSILDIAKMKYLSHTITT